MRFFRDVSRHKARQRLHGGNAVALTTLVLGQEQPLRLHDNDESSEDVGADFTMTARELAAMDGKDGKPLYLAIRGRIYDVTSGRSFYGYGRSYHHFVGRDASRAFATGCTQPACLVSHLDGLSSDDLREVDRWVELYEFHDKYSYVGKLVSEDPVGDAVDAAMREEEALRAVEEEVAEQNKEDGEVRVRPLAVTSRVLVDALVRKGKERYISGSMSEATMFWSAALTRMGSLTEGGMFSDVEDGREGITEEIEAADAAVNGQAQEDEQHLKSIHVKFWAEGMLRRADILSFLAAASQKRWSTKSLEEARARYIEASTTVSRVIRGDISDSGNVDTQMLLPTCILAKAWLLRARIDGDLAALGIMRSAVSRSEGRGDGYLEPANLLIPFDMALATFSKAYDFVLACDAGEETGGAKPGGGDLESTQHRHWRVLKSNTEQNLHKLKKLRD